MPCDSRRAEPDVAEGLVPLEGLLRGHRLARGETLGHALRRPQPPHRPDRPPGPDRDHGKGGLFRGPVLEEDKPVAQARQDVPPLPERRGLHRLPGDLHRGPRGPAGQVRGHPRDQEDPRALQGGHRRRVRHRRPVPLRDPGGFGRAVQRAGGGCTGRHLETLRHEVLLLGHPRGLCRGHGQARGLGEGRALRGALMAARQQGTGDQERVHHRPHQVEDGHERTHHGRDHLRRGSGLSPGPPGPGSGQRGGHRADVLAAHRGPVRRRLHDPGRARGEALCLVPGGLRREDLPVPHAGEPAPCHGHLGQEDDRGGLPALP